MLALGRLRHSLAWAYRKNLEDLYLMSRAGLFSALRRNRDLPGGQPPIFVFHSVTAGEFGAQLAFLRRNGYHSVSPATVLSQPDQKVVCLTFDDARRSLWDAAYLLLREYGYSATCFVPTGCVPSSTPGSQAAGRERGNGAQELCTWTEIRDMAHSGIVDFQSHTHRHLLVETSAQVLDFLHPAMLGKEFANTHLPLQVRERIEREGVEAALGLPVLASAPLFLARTRVVLAGQVALACAEFVQRHGGRSFFRDPDWRKKLRAEFERKVREVDKPFRRESTTDLIASELQASRAALERELGWPVDQLCLPWFDALADNAELVARHGYRYLLWGPRPAAGRLPLSGAVRHLWRVDADFLWTLPGEGSLSPLRVVAGRFRKAASAWRRRSTRGSGSQGDPREMSATGSRN